MASDKAKHVFIIGCKGIPAHYGGFETFVDNLVMRQKSDKIKYHVACMDTGKKEETAYYKADRFFIKTPNIRSARAVLYDMRAMNHAIKQIRKEKLRDGVVYVLACRIGPFFGKYVKKLHKYGFKVYVNPDGHEWMRAKWSKPIKRYWKESENLMTRHADLMICDSINIEKYIKKEYAEYNPKTTYISYGADTSLSKLSDNDKKLSDWYKKWGIKKKEYYLMVGRFVPENNYEAVINEFIDSKTNKDLVIITNHDGNKYYNQLAKNTYFEHDDRIKFVGTVYDPELIKKIRENSFANIHGHSVGGTNPSLLEALASTNINILYDCGFNREVAKDGAFYFSKEEGDLRKLIDDIEHESEKTLDKKFKENVKHMEKDFDWDVVVNQYEKEIFG